MDIKNIIQSKNFKNLLIAIVGLIAIIIIFKIGENFGYQKAQFYGRFGEGYRQTFGGPREGKMGMMGDFFRDPNLPNSHGVIGKIVKIDLPEIIVLGQDNIEKIVKIDDKTQIVKFRENIKSSELNINDDVVIIGSPDDSSKIEARFIRVIGMNPKINNSTEATTTKK